MPRHAGPASLRIGWLAVARRIALAVLALALPAAGLAQQGDDISPGRPVTGALSYPENIPLPAEAVATVTVTGAFGAQLGLTRLSADGERVALPFRLEVPPDLSGRLRAVVRLRGTPRWVVKDVTVAAGSDTLDLGTLTLKPVTPLAFPTRYLCGDTEVLIGVLDDHMELHAAGRDIALAEVPAASGSRYAGVTDPTTVVHAKADRALIKLEGRDLPECRVAPPPSRAPYHANGNEPGWSLGMSEDTLTLSLDYGDREVTLPRPAARAVPGAYRFRIDDADMTLTVSEDICRDTATGMPYPHRAELRFAGRRLKGCGGDPFDLLTGGIWQVATIQGEAALAPERTTIGFAPPDRVAGGTGCNRFTGLVDLTGEGMRFGPAASTRMACPDPQMAQEMRFLDALEQVRRFDIEADGTLRLIGPDGAVLTARRRTAND